MNFFKKYPDAKPRTEGGEEYEGCMVLVARKNKDIEVGDEYQPCKKCGDYTRWLEINYGAFVCSEECLQEMDTDFRDLLQGEIQRERSYAWTATPRK